MVLKKEGPCVRERVFSDLKTLLSVIHVTFVSLELDPEADAYSGVRFR